MIDPLAELVTLLQPSAGRSKKVTGNGAWQVSRSDVGQPFYCAILEGSCHLAVDGLAPMELQVDDFVMIPAAYDFVMCGHPASRTPAVETLPVEIRPGEYSVGDERDVTTVQMVIGHCTFGSPDAPLLVSLLPKVVHVQNNKRLAALVQLVRDELSELRPVRDTVLGKLLDVIFIEALRSTALNAKTPGFLRGLGDERVAIALRLMHQDPARGWSVEQLAREAALSRSGFFARFNQAMGVSPMTYLLTWRMALAKQLLGNQRLSIVEIAAGVGYGSASAFSVAFTRHAGCSPARYARRAAQPGDYA